MIEKIYIASDHAGFELKEKIILNFKDLNFDNLGTNSSDSVDYPDFAHKLSKKIIDDNSCFGVLMEMVINHY